MFKKLKSLLLVGVLTLGMVGCNSTNTSKEDDTKKVTLVLSVGGVNDESFNQGAWEGAQKASEELGVNVSYLESHSDADYITNIETAIDQESDLVVGVGFQVGDAIKESAKAHPDQKFVTIDSTVEEGLDNVRNISFNEQEAGYLTGLIASQMTKTNVIGWIGGLDIPSCSNFYIGYEKGAKEGNSNIKILKQFTNSFTDAAKGKVVAQQMIKKGADIIFMASGGGNAGSLEAVKEANIKAIGVDMPNNYLAPDYIITSALKNVGEGLALTIEDFLNGNFTSGNTTYDLSNGGVGFEKTNLLSDELIQYVEERLKEYENRN